MLEQELENANWSLKVLRNDHEYMLNSNTRKYHRQDCKWYIQNSSSDHWKNDTETREYAEAERYEPCGDRVYPKDKPWIDWDEVTRKPDE